MGRARLGPGKVGRQMIQAGETSRHGHGSGEGWGRHGVTQRWEVGATVKVGFLSLEITGIELTPGDGRPDRYILQHANGKRYTFTPHYGLERID